MEFRVLTDCERVWLAFIETLRTWIHMSQAMLYCPAAAGQGVSLVRKAGRRLVHGETHRRLPANETELFHVHAVHERDPHRVAQRCDVMRCDVL